MPGYIGGKQKCIPYMSNDEIINSMMLVSLNLFTAVRYEYLKAWKVYDMGKNPKPITDSPDPIICDY